MDRTIFGKKTLNTQRNRVDRFVAPRNSFGEARRRRSWHASCDSTVNSDVWFGKHLKQKKYAIYLDDALNLEPQETNGIHKQWIRPWPCIPRKKSYLSSADSILDLPTYSYATFPELLDWSNDNILVAALGKNYHKWSWRSQSLISQGFTQYEIQCCKFDPRGELLALGTDMNTVEIHDNTLSKKVSSNLCPCLNTSNHYCSITAVDWSPTGNSFVTGCSWGSVVSYSRDAKLCSWRRPVRAAILLVRVSPDARYAAVTAVSSAVVLLLTWPSLEIYSSLDSNWTIRTMTWHPWRSALLGVGAVTPDLQARIALWNAPTSKVRETTLGPKRYSLDAMLFSQRTGELVLSLWNSDRAILHPKSCSQLVVMSDPETVVDQWGEGRSGLDRVRTMVFSPDGTKLATATSDEDLIIWNFLPEDKRKTKTKCKRFSAIPVYLDEAMQGYSLR
ncbi:protein cortex [Vanessa atalanta]|uniref:protein cortex n=1 Tax=Vanessa atalanta TaxID=42275 RepID=UPI001FCDB38B|nr:protein cortex [Vanessa atalanta]